MASGQPFDSNHPGINNLTENEKDKLIELNDKEPEDLTPREKALDDKLKNIMATGLPINKEHPGIPNLWPPELEKYDALERQKKRRKGKLTDPDLKNQLSDLQKKIRDGAPIDENHPGFEENLTPNQQNEFLNLANKD